MLSFAGTKVGLGQTAELRLKVAESYTAEPVSIPVTVVRGAPGPILCVTATVHGDELNGVGILRSLLNDTDFTGPSSSASPSSRSSIRATPSATSPGWTPGSCAPGTISGVPRSGKAAASEYDPDGARARFSSRPVPTKRTYFPLAKRRGLRGPRRCSMMPRSSRC